MTGGWGLDFAAPFAHSPAPGILVQLLEEPGVVVWGNGTLPPAPSRPWRRAGSAEEEPQDPPEDGEHDHDDKPEQFWQRPGTGAGRAYDINNERDVQCDEHQNAEHAQHEPPPR